MAREAPVDAEGLAESVAILELRVTLKGGARTDMSFIRKSKIADLLRDGQPLGHFLRDLILYAHEMRADRERQH